MLSSPAFERVFLVKKLDINSYDHLEYQSRQIHFYKPA